VNRYAALYLATLLIIVPIDFLLASSPRASSRHRSAICWARSSCSAILFYLLYVAGIVTFVSGRRRHLAIDGALRRAVRTVLLRDFELTSMSMLKDRSWAVVVVDIALGLVRDGGRIDRRAAHGELGGGKILGRHFGCGTIRIYGFGDFQPCG